MRRVIESVTRADMRYGNSGAHRASGPRCGPHGRSAGAAGSAGAIVRVGRCRSYREAGALRRRSAGGRCGPGMSPPSRHRSGRRRSGASARRALSSVALARMSSASPILRADLVGPDALGGLDRVQRRRPGGVSATSLRAGVRGSPRMPRGRPPTSRSATRWTLWRARLRARAIWATVIGAWSAAASTCQRALVWPAGRAISSPAAVSSPLSWSTWITRPAEGVAGRCPADPRREARGWSIATLTGCCRFATARWP